MVVLVGGCPQGSRHKASFLLGSSSYHLGCDLFQPVPNIKIYMLLRGNATTPSWFRRVVKGIRYVPTSAFTLQLPSFRQNTEAETNVTVRVAHLPCKL